MNRYTPLRTRSPLKKVNRERRERTFARNFGNHADWVRSRGCQLAAAMDNSRRTPCEGRIRACHVKHAGMGGCNGDKKDLVGGCDRHHDELDGRRPVSSGAGPQSFSNHYRIEPEEIAARNWRKSPFGEAEEERNAF